MSLILEALRRSEADRRRGETPSVHGELPPAPRAPKPRIPAASGWLLAAIALVLSAWAVHAFLDRAQDAGAPATHRTVTKRAAAPAASLPPVRHLTPPPVVVVAPTAARIPPPAQPSARAAPPATSEAPIPAPAPPPAAAALHDDTMRLSDLDPEQRKALPPLKLSMHMWNDDPSQRFVILDGTRLREGDRIGDAVVTAITHDGVVLDWNGRKLELSIR
jgi:general secretion pathway protein B